LDVPGVYDFISNADYHTDPVKGGSLSSSGARYLISTCPAKFRYRQLNPGPPPAPKSHFDMGHAAHRLVLGGPTIVAEHPATEDEVGWDLVTGDNIEIVVIHAQDWRSSAAKARRDWAHMNSRVPLLAKDWLVAQAMATSLREIPIVQALLAPGTGWPELTLVWRDEDTGVMCRCRPDWLPRRIDGRRTVLCDYKSCLSADPEALGKAVENYGYHQQAAWYLDGAAALGLAEPDAPFVFIAQEKEPPNVVTYFEVDPDDLEVGRIMNRWALEQYAECKATNDWPPYSREITMVSRPPWAQKRDRSIFQ
jgi:hypothetical protein